MVREIRVHDYDKVTGCVLQAVDVCGAEAELPRSRVEFYAGAIGFDELFGDGLGAVRGAVVDDYDFPVEFAVEFI